MDHHDTGLAALGRQTALEQADSLPQVVARWLRISVSRDGRPIVQVSFPAQAIVDLAELVPDDVRPRIAATNLDLERLAATVAARGCPPGEIFSLSGSNNVVRAWLE